MFPAWNNVIQQQQQQQQSSQAQVLRLPCQYSHLGVDVFVCLEEKSP